MRRHLGLLALATALLAGCESDPTAPLIEDTVFNPSLEVDLDASTRTVTGLYFRDIEVGGGVEATPGDSASLNYSLYLVNGTLVSQNDADVPFRVEVGAGTIDGFNQGIPGMRVGGSRQLIIPPSLGYGDRPNGPIPGNSILVFVVELLQVDEQPEQAP